MQHSRLNVPNRTLYHGDNLKFMRALDSNSVHLIATDPPFNKGRDFHATPDSLAAGAICIAIPSSLNCGTSGQKIKCQHDLIRANPRFRPISGRGYS